MKRLYERGGVWVRGLPRGWYTALLASSSGVGVLLAGLFLRSDFPLVQALVSALLVVGLEYTFGLHPEE